MTAPTREQVVQWATDSNGQLVRGAHPGMVGFYPAALDNFATLARADLEATIAEQNEVITALQVGLREKDAEIDRGAIQFMDLSAQICSLKKDVAHLQMTLAAAEALELGTAEKVVTQQANIAQLHYAASRVLRNKRGEDDWLILAIDCVALEEALAIQPDETALREHDAKLVERIIDSINSEYHRPLAHIPDKIRKGEF